MTNIELERSEEKANFVTHAMGVIFCLVAIPTLLLSAYTSTWSTIVGVCVFGFAMLMVYLSSSIYHATNKNTPIKYTFQILDHISIFIMIGGTYTPIVIKYTQTFTAAIFLTSMWSLIVVGSILKLFFTGKYNLVETMLYLALGWMAIFIIRPLIANMPTQIFALVLAGGLFYSAGVIFFLWKKLPYNHAVWHIFVLAGTVLHFLAVYKSITIHIKV